MNQWMSLGTDAELVLEHAAGPDRGRLLVFRDADTLAAQILRPLDPGIRRTQIEVWKNRRIVNTGSAHPVPVALASRWQRGHRHLRDVEIAEAELAPENLGRVKPRRKEFDPFRLDLPVQHGVRPCIRSHCETELKLGHVFDPDCQETRLDHLAAPRKPCQKLSPKTGGANGKTTKWGTSIWTIGSFL